MAKARWIKPEFFTDAKLCRVSDQACLVFASLWVDADDGGVAPGDPQLIYGRRFIKRDGWSPEKIAAFLRELENVGVIRCFSEKDESWVWLPKLMEQQGTNPKQWRHLGKTAHDRAIRRISQKNGE